MNKKEMVDRNAFIIRTKQEHPEYTDQKIMDEAHALFGGSRKRQRVAQIWKTYMGKYDLRKTYILIPKK